MRSILGLVSSSLSYHVFFFTNFPHRDGGVMHQHFFGVSSIAKWRRMNWDTLCLVYRAFFFIFLV
jgi:hypothetical protein